MLLIVSIVYSLGVAPGGSAQEMNPDAPVYIVVEGDSLWSIANRFGVSLDDLTQANGMTDAEPLNIGDRLVIPGLSGFAGELDTRTVAFGESLTGLSRRYGISRTQLGQLNQIASPEQLATGTSLVLPAQPEIATGFERWLVGDDLTLLELAARSGGGGWDILARNDLPGVWAILPGDVLLTEGDSIDSPVSFPGWIHQLEIQPLPTLQGKTVVLRVQAVEGVNLRGEFMGHSLHFLEQEPGLYIALQGMHALADPGYYSLGLSAELLNDSGSEFFSYIQSVPMQALNYPYDRPLNVDPATIDPAITRPEDAQWVALTQLVTPERLWSEEFWFPSPLDEDYCIETGECWSSRFGNRRSYNGGPYNAFHTGLDIVGRVGTEIYAPAEGVVVFAGPLTVRGNATMIDHGWGVYTGYMHQSEIMVEVGDRVVPGQTIGLIGATGRVEGPHLHWEVWANGVQVDPIDWLIETYP